MSGSGPIILIMIQHHYYSEISQSAEDIFPRSVARIYWIQYSKNVQLDSKSSNQMMWYLIAHTQMSQISETRIWIIVCVWYPTQPDVIWSQHQTLRKVIWKHIILLVMGVNREPEPKRLIRVWFHRVQMDKWDLKYQILV
jgi:hypothetical protein